MLTENNPYTSETTEASYQIYADNVEEMKRRAERDYYKQRNTTKQDSLLEEMNLYLLL